MSDVLEMLHKYNIITPAGKVNKMSRRMVQKNPTLQESIFTATNFLPNDVDLMERIGCIRLRIEEVPLCAHCKRKLKFDRHHGKYDRYCSLKCSNNDPTVQKKKEKTCLQNFGVTNPSKSDTIQRKKEHTSIENYGTPHPRQSHISQETYDKLNDKSYLIQQHHENRKTILEIANELKISPYPIYAKFQEYDIETFEYNISYIEKEVQQFLEDIGISNIKVNSRRILYPNEIDIYLPDFGLAVEVNGIYWHSEVNGKKGRTYHLDKTNACEDLNIQLIHLFESEWKFKKEIVKSRFLSKLNLNTRIFGRKCSFKNVSNKEKSIFLNENHIQGNRSSLVNLGLMYEDELVAIMTFGKPRYNNKYQWELIRYTSKKYTNVVGGASKLFKWFIEWNSPETIISYADKRWGTGNMYEKLGFSFSHNSNPNYYYHHISKPIKLHSRIDFQKHKLKDKLEFFDPGLSEWDNMKANGYDRIWDCGNAVYVWTK